MAWQQRILSLLFATSSLLASPLTAQPFELQQSQTFKDQFFAKNNRECFLLSKQKKSVIRGRKKLKVEFKGKKGSRGNRGPQGIRGRQGIQGIQGAQGVQGNQGVPGPAGPVNFLARNNFFVDLTTTQNQLTADGTIAQPFSTIQGAINYIQLHHTPTNVQEFETGATLLIAAGWYQEQVTITGDNNRITLVPLGNVTLGPASGSVPALIYNLTSANTNFSSQYRASLAFGTTSPDRGTSSTITDLSPSVPSFLLRFGMTATSASTVPADLILNGVDTGNINASSTVSTLNLFFYNSLCDGVVLETPISTPPAMVVIANASKTSFQGLVNVDSFYAAEDCVFRGGLTLNQNDMTTSTSNKERIGFKYCQFYAGTINLPVAQPRLFVDAFTNAWIRQTAGAALLSYTPPSHVGVKLDAIADSTVDP